MEHEGQKYDADFGQSIIEVVKNNLFNLAFEHAKQLRLCCKDNPLMKPKHQEIIKVMKRMHSLWGRDTSGSPTTLYAVYLLYKPHLNDFMAFSGLREDACDLTRMSDLYTSVVPHMEGPFTKIAAICTDKKTWIDLHDKERIIKV